jgi:D-alanyl-D-alanine carboxypeptidase
MTVFSAFVVLSCTPSTRQPVEAMEAVSPAKKPNTIVERTLAAAAGLPTDLSAALEAAARTEGAEFETEIAAALMGDPALTLLVDKRRALPASYAPADLEDLGLVASRSGNAFKVNRSGLTLRAEAATALASMAKAARADGVTLLVSSAYRSYAYQETVYARVVAELGQEAADRESARPGRSQHQLGLAADFGSIDDSFAETAAGRWLAANAARFGWSLSFPKGYEAVTGYRWESWHYRYVGKTAAALIERRFGGIQQYCLEFLDGWKKAAPAKAAQ